MTPLEQELYGFVISAAEAARGLIRSRANQLLEDAGLPTIPLGANGHEAIKIADEIRVALRAKAKSEVSK